MALLGLSSSLLAAGTQKASLVGPSLFYFLAYQTLKGPPLLVSFSISQLWASVWGDRGYSDFSTHCTWLSSNALLPWLPKLRFPSPVSSGYLLKVSSSPCPRITLQYLWSSSQLPCTVVDLLPCLEYIDCLCDSHSIQTFTDHLLHSPQQPQILPFCFNQLPWMWGSLPYFSPTTRCRLVLLTLLLFPSFLHPAKLCMEPCILFQWSGTPASIQLVFCDECCHL